MKKIVVTGNMGYVGSVVIPYLRDRHKDAYLIGYDTGYFSHQVVGDGGLPEVSLDCQYFGDMRKFPADILANADAVVHLAAVSNDPMGKEFAAVTHEVNQETSVRLVSQCVDAGVKNFVFASSCSMYGSAGAKPKAEHDETNPLTAYAESKVGTEVAVARQKLAGTTVTFLRFATACGMSPRVRLDLVLNDFVATAVCTKTLTVLSDGTPWRPLIDVADMAKAIDWAIRRHRDVGGQCLAVNVGTNAHNFQVRQLAEAVAELVPGTTVTINTNAPPDKRSYRVDFSLYESLAPENREFRTLKQSIQDLAAGLSVLDPVAANPRTSPYTRLNTLRRYVEKGVLGQDLYWKKRI